MWKCFLKIGLQNRFLHIIQIEEVLMEDRGKRWTEQGVRNGSLKKEFSSLTLFVLKSKETVFAISDRLLSILSTKLDKPSLMISSVHNRVYHMFFN